MDRGDEQTFIRFYLNSFGFSQQLFFASIHHVESRLILFPEKQAIVGRTQL
jgi:hypothetical protein